MKPNSDKSWAPHPKQGDLVKCADWTRFPGQVGFVLHTILNNDNYEKDDIHAYNMDCKVLVDGQVWDFLVWDIKVISE